MHNESYKYEGASRARREVIIRTTEINGNNFIFNFRLANLDLDFKIRVSEFSVEH